MKRYFIIFSLLLLITLITGCVSVDYLGQEMPAKSADTRITIYNATTDYPPQKYKVFGKAEFTVPPRYPTVELYEKLHSEARKRGADAIKVVSVTKVKYSPYRYDYPSVGLAKESEYAQFGSETKETGIIPGKPITIVKTLFLSETDTFNSVMAKRKELRENF